MRFFKLNNKKGHELNMFNPNMGVYLAANQALNCFLNNEKSSCNH